MYNEDNSPEEILATLAPDEQEWTSFLEERPKTKVFYRSLVLGSIIILQLQRGGKTIHYEDYKPIDVLHSTGDLFPPLEMLYSQVMTGHILSGHHTLPTNLGDEETLAESILRFDQSTSIIRSLRIQSILESTALKRPATLPATHTCCT